MWLLLALACGPGTSDVDCIDADCRRDAILAQWEGSPQAAIAAVNSLPDPIEQVAAISALTDQFPGQVGPLCRELPRGISRERCLEMNARPHLWNERPEVAAVSRAGAGPASSYLRAADVPMSLLIDVRGDSRICADEVDPHACAWKRATEAAGAGKIDDAAKACASVRSLSSNRSTWRHECFFSAAEAHIQKWGRARYKDTLALCGAAGSFRAECVTHTLTELAQRVPGSDMADPHAWAEHGMRAHDIDRAWASSQVKRDILDKFWALSTAFAVLNSRGLSGDALDWIPAEEHRHLRAAIAWRLAQERDPVETNLQAEVDLLATVLERRIGRMEASDLESRLFEGVPDLWPVDRDGEAHLAAISYLGNSRRTAADDPAADSILCILEAAARSDPPQNALLEEGQVHPDERIRWTATRLIERIEARDLKSTKPSRTAPSPGFTRPGPAAPK